MTTNTYPTRTTSRRDPSWKRQGFDSREDKNWHRRHQYGTNGGRQRPRDRKPAAAFDLAQPAYVGDEKARLIDAVWTKLDRLAGPEAKYPRDGGLLHLYAEGDLVWTTLDEAPLTVTQTFSVFERLRYRVQFASGVSIALTQGQLLAVVDAGRAEAWQAFNDDLLASFLEILRYREVMGLKRGSRRKDVRK
jgi:hypothetical protein